jgi:hypothetical protein
MSSHPDDNFHAPKDADPFWTETSWWTFAIPERRLSGQLYPFFRPNQGVAACAVYLWNDQGAHFNDALYARQTWHLPLPESPLTDLALPNGLRYRCLEPRTKYALSYVDPDGDDIRIDLEFNAIVEPFHTGHGHFDQPGRMTGTLVLDGEELAIDCFGFRDRSWGRRGGFGRKMVKGGGQVGGYSFATASERDGFFGLSFDRDDRELIVHGYLLQDGELSPLREGEREVVSRDPATGYPTEVRVHGTDEHGRILDAHGICRNTFAFLLNPNIWSVNCLTEWVFGGHTAWGEDHENLTPYAYRRFYRSYRGHSPALPLTPAG